MRRTKVAAQYLLLIPIVAILSACFATTIKNINEYDNKPMQKSDVVLSAEQMENRPFKVIVFNINENKKNLAQAAEAGNAIARAVNTHVGKSNTVMLDNKGLKELQQALTANNTTYKPQTNADYAIIGDISLAKFTKKYNKPEPMGNQKTDSNAQVKYTAPSCSYDALVQGQIHIHSLRSMQRVHTISISGGANRHVTLKGTVGYRGGCQDLPRDEVLSLVRRAAYKAAAREDVQIQHFFRPKGYV